ncbi:serine/threonine-protein kinase BLUS1 isoform X1 [Brassica napus]|uniref:serine/threonine-protein kinase BLUS1 isoform X1 n=1 Tax=Brassica napus TaxID=3708 RepID=UPI0020789338|nr:serine/threonine-protein kinase BLUS1 isoform X1 [Brassica napus]XP_048604400.1 serine/threonine-protein kinase BLUS1 isoform X1 [Brassica napus]
MESGSEKKFPLDAKDYKLHEEIGDGVSATVYRALCIPLNEVVAIKVLDLEKCNNDLDGIRREVQTMSLISHPNVLQAHCSFTARHQLWVVMPYMAAGSCLHIIKSSYQDGFEEPVIATLLRETLRALVYLHAHGHIHRDVKAGNILLDSSGTVKLADFGVSACMFDTGDRQRSRNTFVGTPCWYFFPTLVMPCSVVICGSILDRISDLCLFLHRMAPEVMQQLHGYDFKADVWSFGITALELAHGHAPFSKYPPMKVLLMTLQNAPPGLDYERDKRFSKAFKEMVGICLVKDPKKRPTSEKLLKHPFFKQARAPDYMAKAILNGLPPLGERYRTIKSKEADLLMQNKSEYEAHLSQQEYIRGVSAWNFNLEDLKNQAALISDDDSSHAEEPDFNKKQCEIQDESALSPERASSSETAPSQDDELNDIHDLESSFASFPSKPLQALKGCFDIDEDEDNETIGTQAHTTKEEDTAAQISSLPRHVISEQKKYSSGSILPEGTFSPKKTSSDAERDFQQRKYQTERSYSGSLYRTKRDTVDETSEAPYVEHKGRFKVTSADLSPKGSTNSSFTPFGGGSSSPSSLNATAVSILQSILQQNTMQREEILRLVKYVEQTSVKQPGSPETSLNELLQTPPATLRERELQTQLMLLQQSFLSLTEEVKKHKQRNGQLENQLNVLTQRND